MGAARRTPTIQPEPSKVSIFPGPERLTKLPPGIGPLYRLCKVCHGTGERLGHRVGVDAKTGKEERDPNPGPILERERDCPNCGGKGEVLS